MVLSRRPSEHLRRIEWKHAESLTATEERDALKFEERDGMLRNILTRQVPRLAAHYAEQVLNKTLERTGVGRSDISTWIMHPGGRDVLYALETQMGLSKQDLRFSAAILRDYGNLSSASVYFV